MRIDRRNASLCSRLDRLREFMEKRMSNRISRLCNVLLVFVLLNAVAVRCFSNEIKLEPGDSREEVIKKAVQVVPSPQQYAWQQYEVTAFIHFTVNAFTNKEWGDGTEDPKIFNPVKLDARQWMKALKDAGAKLVILTAKHHDGFCLWPSKYTEHSVKNSPWKDGKGDVVKEASEAAREFGLKFGVYISPWDRHEKSFGTAAYNDYYKNQVRELLTNYGEISEVWMDGACDWDHDNRCKDMPYDFPGIFKLVHELQPNAVIAIYGPDVRWVGNEGGRGRASEWSVVPERIEATAQDIGSIDKLMEAAKDGQKIKWYPAETDVSIRPGWFYHRAEDYMVKPPERLLDIYFDSVGANSVLLLNVPPDTNGLFSKFDVKSLKQFGTFVGKIFEKNLASGAAAEASASAGGGKNPSENITDGDNETYWTTDDGAESASVVFDLGGAKTFDVAMIQEYIKDGQRIEEFRLEAQDGSGWKEIARGTTVGYKRLLRFEPVTATKVRLTIDKSRIRPTLSSFGLYNSQKEG